MQAFRKRSNDAGFMQSKTEPTIGVSRSSPGSCRLHWLLKGWIKAEVMVTAMVTATVMATVRGKAMGKAEKMWGQKTLPRRSPSAGSLS